jgi:ABC-type multidrug transport system fused ATPase/permease subunit
MLSFLVAEAALAAGGTALIIRAGQDVAHAAPLMRDLVWIVVAQSVSYGVGAVSWVFAEQAGFGAFGRYMLRFARDNKPLATLLGDGDQREVVEPFLTNEAFHLFFELIYELEADLKLFFSLLFNSLVLGYAIDAGLPWVYGAVFVLLLGVQWLVRKPVADTYLQHQRATNRMTAHTYTAWDNIFSGNRYNFRLWHSGFKQRLRAALAAQIRAILAREGLAAISGIIALGLVFSYLAWVAAQDVGDAGLLIALAATLPRQIDMASNMHGLASGWNDLQAVWTRIGGACNAMRPQPDADFESRICFAQLALHRNGQPLPCTHVDDALHTLTQAQQGRILVRGGNGSGKSTLLAALKTRLGTQAFYWPTADKLAFAFAQSPATSDGDEADADEADADDADTLAAAVARRAGFSSGERQLKSLREIVAQTQARVYLLDEWDANLDAVNRVEADSLVRELAQRAWVVEISHRDRG